MGDKRIQENHLVDMESPKSIAESSFYDPAIDGLRGIAILSVILNHAMYCAHQDPTRSFRFPLLLRIGEGGAGGVSLFFVLSALTLMMATRARFSIERSPRIAFYVRRAFRILPLWWIFIAISVIARNPPDNEIVPHIFMYFGFLPHMNFTHVGWSLFVEETFYLFFPLIFSWLLTSVGAGLFFILVIVCSGRLFSPGLDEVFQISRIPLFFHYVTFALGIIGFHFLKFSPARARRMSSFFNKFLWDIFAAASFLLYFLCQPHGNIQIFACFIMVLAGLAEGTYARKILSLNVLRNFGTCCYSIYLFHGLFLFSIRYTDWFRHLGAEPMGPDFQLLFAFVLASVASYGFGMISFRFLERPSVLVGRRVIQKLGLSF